LSGAVDHVMLFPDEPSLQSRARLSKKPSHCPAVSSLPHSPATNPLSGASTERRGVALTHNTGLIGGEDGTISAVELAANARRGRTW
jgi:hypothetical protein